MTATLIPPARSAPKSAPRRSRVASALATTVLVLAIVVVLALAVGPLFLPYRITTTQTGSMRPTIPQGSLVVDRKVPAGTLRPGDIITFTVPNAHVTVTHRLHAVVIDHGSTFFITKGDANATPDAWRIPAVGDGYIEWFHIPYVGHVTAITHSRRAAAGLIAVAAILVVASLLMSHRRKVDHG